MRSNNCNRYRNWHQISIHPSLAGRDLLGADCHQVLDISIHPSLAGRDARCRQLCINVRISIHPSLAGRDRGHGQSGAQERISIHPSLAGRDCSSLIVKVPGNYFNPPVPRGTGPSWQQSFPQICYFNPPVPRGTGPLFICGETISRSISIHPSLAGRDVMRS